jgi:hypothetical protein
VVLGAGDPDAIGTSDVTELGPVEQDGTPEIVDSELSASASVGDGRIDICAVFSCILLNTELCGDCDRLVLGC